MPDGGIRVKGYKEFLQACDHAEKRSRRNVRSTFRIVGEDVRADAERLFAAYGKAASGAARYGGTRASHADSASGYRVRVRQRGIIVEQSKKRTTGKHPEYGAVQMRHALIPARSRNEDKTEAAFQRALDDVADHFDNLGG